MEEIKNDDMSLDLRFLTRAPQPEMSSEEYCPTCLMRFQGPRAGRTYQKHLLSATHLARAERANIDKPPSGANIAPANDDDAVEEYMDVDTRADSPQLHRDEAHRDEAEQEPDLAQAAAAAAAEAAAAAAAAAHAAPAGPAHDYYPFPDRAFMQCYCIFYLSDGGIKDGAMMLVLAIMSTYVSVPSLQEVQLLSKLNQSGESM
jgi:hypothetical protein